MDQEPPVSSSHQFIDRSQSTSSLRGAAPTMNRHSEHTETVMKRWWNVMDRSVLLLLLPFIPLFQTKKSNTESWNDAMLKSGVAGMAVAVCLFRAFSQAEFKGVIVR